jgi:hypothetical protein
VPQETQEEYELLFGMSLDLGSVPYVRGAFGNLDFVLLLLGKNGPMKRKDIVEACRKWRGTAKGDALYSTGKPSVQLAYIFTKPSNFHKQMVPNLKDYSVYFDSHGKGIWDLSPDGLEKAHESLKIAKQLLASGKRNVPSEAQPVVTPEEPKPLAANDPRRVSAMMGKGDKEWKGLEIDCVRYLRDFIVECVKELYNKR